VKSREVEKAGWLRGKYRKAISLILTVGLLVILTLTTAAPALASYWDHYFIGGDTQSSFDGVYWEAQTFTPAETFCLSSVSFQIWADPEYTGTITVSLRATENGAPTGADLCSRTLDEAYLFSFIPSEPPGSFTTQPLGEQDVQYPLTVGTQYAFVIRADYDSDGDFHMRYDSTGDYGGGARYSSSDSGATWTAHEGEDYLFGLESKDPFISIDPSSGLTTTESGGSATFDINFYWGRPAADVIVGLSSSDTSEGTVSPSSLTFTPYNWDIPQTVTITGVDDLADDGDVVYTIITAPVVSEDINYSGFNFLDLTVTNLDDGEPPANIPPVATDDKAATNEDTSVIIDVLDNDTDADGGTLTVTTVTQPANGVASYPGSGLFSDITYTPYSNFNGDDSFTYSISDLQGGSDTATVNIKVLPVNDPFIITAYDPPAPVTMNEGGSQIFSVTASDIDGDVLTYSWTKDSSQTGTDSPSYTFQPGYTAAGTYNIACEVSDGFVIVLQEWKVVVEDINRAPDAVDDTAVTTEDNPVTIYVLTNDSDLDGDSLTVDSITPPDHGTILTIQTDGLINYEPNPDYYGQDSFTYTVSDGNGGTDSATVNITINSVNDAPVAGIGGPYETNEGTALQFNGSGSDPDGTIVSWAWDFAGLGSSTEQNPSFIFFDDGDYVVTLTVTDDGGATWSGETIAIINDLQPVAALTGDPVLDVGQAGNYNASSSTSNPDAISSYEWDWDYDGSTFNTSGDTGVTHSHAWSVSGTYTVAVRLTDDDGSNDIATLQVTVNEVNEAPLAVDDETTTDENISVAIDVLANDSDANGDSLTVNSVTQPDHGTAADNGDGTITYTPDAGWYGQDIFTYTVSDGRLTDIATVTITVNSVNEAPIVGPITAPVDPVQVNVPVGASAGFTDPNTGDTHTAVWDWGDGTTSSGTVLESSGAGSVSDSHTYSEPGLYPITLTVTDNHGAEGQAIYRYVIVCNPSRGFITGGGWIESPEGAYAADPSLTGKATFGFVSKYKKRATVPTGNTEFQFHAGGLNFHSSSYDWLVIAGNKALYKGTGTINGEGNYGLMLTAVDAKLTPSIDVDLFRIKIWDKVTGKVVYDNQMGDEENADLTTAIGSGNIVIHKSK